MVYDPMNLVGAGKVHWLAESWIGSLINYGKWLYGESDKLYEFYYTCGHNRCKADTIIQNYGQRTYLKGGSK